MGPYQETGLLTAEGETIKNKEEMLAVVEALLFPFNIKKGLLERAGVGRGDRMTGEAARGATTAPTAHIPGASPFPAILTDPDYTAADKKDQARCKGIHRKDGWLYNKEGHTILPKEFAR